jgi:hypothetical protein
VTPVVTVGTTLLLLAAPASARLGRAPLAAIQHAVESPVPWTLVFFDVDHRATLWPDEEATPVLARLAAAADPVFATTAQPTGPAVLQCVS